MQVKNYYSDDYAGLLSGDFEFYYGYEETVDTPYDEDMWCFVVKKEGKLIYSATSKEIEDSGSQLDSVRDYLIVGIGMWLADFSD